MSLGHDAQSYQIAERGLKSAIRFSTYNLPMEKGLSL